MRQPTSSVSSDSVEVCKFSAFHHHFHVHATDVVYSGAFSALVIASLLDLAGIPKSHGDEATSDLFNKFWNNELEDPAASRAAKEKYNCKYLHV
jgi:hypothetical protein